MCIKIKEKEELQDEITRIQEEHERKSIELQKSHEVEQLLLCDNLLEVTRNVEKL